jgi:hypothetical protein
MSPRRLLLPCFVIAIAAGCSSTNASTESPEPDAGPGATKPTDGAKGVCCPAKTGGCALEGGYHADGICPTSGPCDNMCEQRIVDDEHGCKKLTYKTPPVTTTFAGTGSCSDPIFNGGGPDSGAHDGGDGGTSVCDYPDAGNDARCPAVYKFSLLHQACPAVGLTCAYPGQGDGTSGGCFATAMLWCVADGGLPNQDAGPDAGPGTWLVAQ